MGGAIKRTTLSPIDTFGNTVRAGMDGMSADLTSTASPEELKRNNQEMRDAEKKSSLLTSGARLSSQRSFFNILTESQAEDRTRLAANRGIVENATRVADAANPLPVGVDAAVGDIESASRKMLQVPGLKMDQALALSKVEGKAKRAVRKKSLYVDTIDATQSTKGLFK